MKNKELYVIIKNISASVDMHIHLMQYKKKCSILMFVTSGGQKYNFGIMKYVIIHTGLSDLGHKCYLISILATNSCVPVPQIIPVSVIQLTINKAT
jgi:hypothetical protein